MMAKVFVVDDETAVRELLYDTLTRRGYEVMTASSGTQALEMLKSHRPELIMLDTAMPGLSGFETARSIRGFDDAVPIIMLRMVGEAEVPVEELRRIGVTEMISKEPNAERFVSALEQALQRLRRKIQPSDDGPAMRIPGTLLAVDDDPQILRLLTAFFESRGMRVISVSSGEAALQALAQKPSAVLLDVNMPGMDGVMTLKKIKAQQPNLPVIIASSVGEEVTVRQALDVGAYDYVKKPFSLEYLETVVLTKVLLGMEG
jgi:DNA-binding response OmpR family regulator